MGNSGVYFITCECFGAKFVKLGRSSDVASRRRELQSGCPFELVIEHVQPLDEKQAIEHERRYRSLFRTMEQRISQVTENSSSTNKKRLTRWFPFTGEIEAFVVQLKEGELPNTALASDPQALLF
ncbi:hypothetical protein Pla100_50900 [Neorhodopirellula pilleata]|uniref:GIY-YIG nuclease family protein n=1 Tax=Neorhodopirellula pilleata TaxID=2714738 RepID=A0A5C5ZXI4_9BACT|nr:hypothetical protein Pla100_50900 [Neorhodopirellula pilleata]